MNKAESVSTPNRTWRTYQELRKDVEELGSKPGENLHTPEPSMGVTDARLESRLMKLVYLHQHFVTPNMPGGTRSYEVARRLVSTGHEVHMLAGKATHGGHHPRLPRWESELVDGIHVHWLSVAYDNTMTSRRRLLSFVLFAILSSIRARAIKGDVLLATSTPLTIAIPAILSTIGKRTQFVFEVRDLWPEVPIALGALKSWPARVAARALARMAYSRAAAIVALTAGMADGIEAVNRSHTPVHQISNSCDNDRFFVDAGYGETFRRSRSWLDDRPLVIYAGAVSMVNGVSYMVRLAEACRRVDPRVQFLVVGAGSDMITVEKLARELNVLDNNFHMEGALAKSEMPLALSAATVCSSFVIPLPVLEMNCANKFFDAMAARRPIIINHGGWQADLITERNLGVVLHPHDHNIAAKQLLDFLANKPRREAASETAGELATGLYDRNRLTLQMERILEDAAQLSRVGRSARTRPEASVKGHR